MEHGKGWKPITIWDSGDERSEAALPRVLRVHVRNLQHGSGGLVKNRASLCHDVTGLTKCNTVS